MLALVGLVPFAIVMVFGPWLFGFVFGDEWHIAGEYAQWLALWLYVSLAARPVIAAIPAMDLQGFFLIHEVLSVALRINNDIDAIALFSIANVFVYGFLIIFVIFKSQDESLNYNKPSLVD
jgi:O-antigen/teichoic acid export membrane protein